MKDIRTIKKYVAAAKKAGLRDQEGLKAAADYFGVTLNAVTLRWKRYKNGVHLDGLKGSTTKKPMARKKRKYTKKTGANRISNRMLKIQAEAYAKAGTPRKEQTESRSITFDIKDVEIDLVNKSFTIIY